jgi:hypothetical protein
MECSGCGHNVRAYLGVNPWYECPDCGRLFCDACSRGEPRGGYKYPTPEEQYKVKMKTCPECDKPLRKVSPM